MPVDKNSRPYDAERARRWKADARLRAEYDERMLALAAQQLASERRFHIFTSAAIPPSTYEIAASWED